MGLLGDYGSDSDASSDDSDQDVNIKGKTVVCLIILYRYYKYSEIYFHWNEILTKNSLKFT